MKFWPFRRPTPATDAELVDVIHELIGEIRTLNDNFTETPATTRALAMLKRRLDLPC